MDKTQSEVTDKIRCAIKEKLIEINVFVDNELPDYIMILIANKRSKHHMEKDLALFLGNQTKDFTNWLWELVTTLKVGTKAKNCKLSSTIDAKQSQSDIEPKEGRNDEEDVLNYDPAEEGESLYVDETSVVFTSSPQIPGTVQSVSDSKLTLLSDLNLSQHATGANGCAVVDIQQEVTDTFSHNKPLGDKSVKESENSAVAHANKMSSFDVKPPQKSAKVYPMQRRRQNFPTSNSETNKNTTSTEGLLNDIKPQFVGNVCSVVCVTQRKYGGAAALQANKLLLRAVNDAAKSVLNGKDINEYYKPTPIKELTSKNLVNTIKNEDILGNRTATEINLKLKQELETAKLLCDDETKIDPVNCAFDDIKNEISHTRHIIDSPQTPIELDDFEDSTASSLSIYDSPLSQTNENELTPHFIVTLDGVEFPSLKRKYSSEEPMEIDELLDPVPLKKQKVQERCKYWPACKNSESCTYHHPTVQCKTFPNCKFGDKCLYIHPNCKFDSLCSRKDCPYTHCSKRKFQVIPTPVVKAVKVPSVKTVCKYYPKCTVKMCRFIHPKLCRFGIKCRAPKCPFSHFQIPQRNQMKWKADLL